MILAMGVFIVCKLVMNSLGRKATESIPVPMVNTEQDREGEEEQYNKARIKEGYGVIMKDYILYLTTVKDINVQKDLCKKVYDMDKRACGRNADLQYMFKLGTNAMTCSFFDLVEGSISVSFQTLFFRLSRHVPIPSLHIMQLVYVSISSFIQACLYYLDLCKDILIATLIYGKVLTSSDGFILTGRWSMPSNMFLAFVSSVVATKICDFIALVRHPEFTTWSKVKRFLAMVFHPLIPAFIHVEKVFHVHKITKLAKSLEAKKDHQEDKVQLNCHQEEMLAKENDRMDRWHELLAYFVANKNSIQDFVQLIALILIILSSNTRSNLHEVFQKMFLDDHPHFLHMSASLSFLSLLRGPTNFISTIKRGFLGIYGQLILFPYFGIGTATRIFMIILLFTPALGLFDTMHLFTKGSMKMKGTTEFAKTWNTNYFIEDISNFLTFPLSIVFLLSVGVLILHLTASSFFIRPHLKDGVAANLRKGVYTIICVPLFIDWEEIFWSAYHHENSNGSETTNETESGNGGERFFDDIGQNNERTGNDAEETLNASSKQANEQQALTNERFFIKEAWMKSKALFFKFTLLFLMEHLLFLAPLLDLKMATRYR